MGVTPRELQQKTIKSNAVSLLLIVTGLIASIPLFKDGKHESILICLEGQCDVNKFLVATKDLTRTNWGKNFELTQTKQGWLIPKHYKVVGYLAPESPYALIRSLLATSLVGAGCIAYSSHTRKLKFEYPQYFEQLKSEVFRSTLIQEEMRAQDERSVAAGNIPSEFELLELEERAKSEKELTAAAHLTQLSELELATAKNRAEIRKLSKSESKPTRSSSPDGQKEEKRQELITLLKEHEGGWLWELVDTLKPVFLVGSQGSWKSYCSAAIALARWHCNGVKLASITDPHFNKNRDESWKQLIALEPEIYGGAQDWLEVKEGILQGFERWNKRTLQDEALTSIWDEQTNWAKHDECKKAGEEFVGRVLADPRKANEGPLIITHSFTNAGTGGGGGFAEARESGVLQLHLNSNNKQQPTFKGKLLGLKNEDGELIEELPITIPVKWFTPKAIASMFAQNSKST